MSNIPAPNLSVMINCSSSVTEKHTTRKAQKCDKAIIFYPLRTHGLNEVNIGGEVTDITTDPEDKYPLTVKTPEVTEEQPANTYTVNGEKFDAQIELEIEAATDEEGKSNAELKNGTVTLTGYTETNSFTPLGGEEITAEMNTDLTVTTNTKAIRNKPPRQ